MICERCNNREATIHLTEIIKDVKSEIHLCEDCAREMGLNSKLSSFSLSVPEMLSFLDLSEIDQEEGQEVCKTCGYTYIDFNNSGRLGCPDCYFYLEEPLKSVISGFHSDTKHIGKIPDNAVNTRKQVHITKEKNPSAEDLQLDLQKAVAEERYEEAAKLRDKIMLLEKDR